MSFKFTLKTLQHGIVQGLILFNMHAVVLANDSVPLTNFLNFSNSFEKRTQASCFAFEDKTPGLPCNPAFHGIRHATRSWIYSYGSNNLKYFQDVAALMDGPVQSAELLPLVQKNSNEHFQLGSSIGYLTDTWGFSLNPINLYLFTHIRNPALPRITVLASREEEAKFQVGSFIDHEWSWGFQVRAIHRRFTYSDSYFADHFTEELSELYKIQELTTYYIEPSLLYAPEDINWKPMLSLMVTNLGDADKNEFPYDFNPRVHFGLSLEQNLGHSLFKTGLTTQWLHNGFNEKLYSGLGMQFQFSLFEVFAHLGELERQLGLGINTDNITTSVAYSEQDWDGSFNEKQKSQWRWDLGFQY